MRKFLLIIIGLLALVFVFYSLAEIEKILATLRQSNPLFLLGVILVEIVLLINNTATFYTIYKLLGLHESLQRMFLIVTASAFINMVTPSVGVGGMAVFIDEARKSGQSTGRAMLSGILYLLYEYATLFVTLAAGFIVLIQNNELNVAEMAAAGILILWALSIAAMLVAGYRSPRQLGDVLAWLARLVNRLVHPLLHKDWLDPSYAYIFTQEITEGLSALRANRRQRFFPLLFTMCNKLLLILVFALSFLAIGVPVEPGTVLAGFAIGLLFYYASPTTSGAGFVDGILPLALNSMGVPFHSAVLITLVYRAFTFWLPLGMGALAFRHLQTSKSTSVNSW